MTRPTYLPTYLVQGQVLLGIAFRLIDDEHQADKGHATMAELQ